MTSTPDLPDAPVRRVPTQERSRRRYEAILAAAHDLVVEVGSDGLKTSEIATRAGVPIGSVYQYFPDKPAILRELAVRLMERVRADLAAALRDITTKQDALARADTVIAGYYARLLDEPHDRDVWAATQSDKELQRLDVEDSRANGAVVHEALRHLVRPADQDRLAAAAFLFAHLAGSTVRLAVAVERAEGDRLVAELRAAVAAHLGALLQDAPGSTGPDRREPAPVRRRRRAS